MQDVPRDEIPGLATRRAALQLLDAIVRRGSISEVAQVSALRDLESQPDRALALAIAGEVLRHMPDLDALIDSATRLRIADDAKVRMVLRIGLAQALILKTPPHAAIATVLPLLASGPRRLAHGVIGTLLRAGATLPSPPSLPSPVAERWEKTWGAEVIACAQSALAEPPPLDLTIKNHDETAIWAERLGGESLAPGHVRLARGGPIEQLPGYDDGAWWVQNLSASIPARLLGEGEGRRVLDLCAAPGGKTMQLAAQGWHVTAVDRDARRLERVKANLTRTGLSAALVTSDIFKFQPDQPFEAILLDAPCTATGTFARHPEVLHRIRPKDIAELAQVQARMLARALGWLKPGGTLIYATCSLEPEEGESIARASPTPADRIAPGELPYPAVAFEQGWIRVLPSVGLDGFFVARFRN